MLARHATSFVVLLLLCLLACAHVLLSNQDLGTLEPLYTDHVRHLRYVQEFPRSGLAIYQLPLSSFPVYGDSRAYIWSTVSYLYPPGALLFYAPFSMLHYGLNMDLSWVSRAILCTLLLFHHAGCFAAVVGGRIRTGLGLLFLGYYYIYGLFWCLNGQYEPVPMFFCILGACAPGSSRQRLLYFSLAIFLKFQALLLLPLIVVTAIQRSRHNGLATEIKDALQSSWFWLLVFSAIALWNCREYLSPAMANPLHYRYLAEGDLRCWTTLVVTLCFALAAAARRAFLLSFLIVFHLFTLVRLAQLQGWHLVFWFGFPLCLEEEWQRELAMAYVLVFFWCYDFGHPYHMLSLILASHR